MSWRAVVVWWLAWSALGVSIIALPDSGLRLVTFSAAHGPGLLDTIGVILLLVGNAALWAFLWKRRGSLTLRGPCAFAAGMGTGLLVASVASDFGAWWAVGAGMLVAVQIGFFITAARAS